MAANPPTKKIRAIRRTGLLKLEEDVSLDCRIAGVGDIHGIDSQKSNYQNIVSCTNRWRLFRWSASSEKTYRKSIECYTSSAVNPVNFKVHPKVLEDMSAPELLGWSRQVWRIGGSRRIQRVTVWMRAWFPSYCCKNNALGAGKMACTNPEGFDSIGYTHNSFHGKFWEKLRM